jgi:hypothetical protein
LGEIPLRVGAQITNGSSRTRIIELGRHDGRLDGIYIEEREAHAVYLGHWAGNWSVRDAERLRYIDRYFVVNRPRGEAQSAHEGELGAIAINSLSVRFHRLSISREKDTSDDVLIKVRFECDHRFERSIDIGLVRSR